MPQAMLNSSQTTTMGANAVPRRAVPKGWIRNKNTRMAHEMPTMADVPRSGRTTVMPWIAPSTDCAGVSTPSAMTMDTPRMPTSFNRVWLVGEFSRKRRRLRDAGVMSPVR